MQHQNVIVGTFPSRLEECLAEKKWTKTELSRQLGLTHPAVLKWWSGQIPRSEALFKMASLFAVSPDWLATGTGSKRAPHYLTTAEIDAIKNGENTLREDPVIYGTDWKSRAITAEQKLADLKASFAELLVKHEIPIPPSQTLEPPKQAP